MNEELEFLRYFYSVASDAMGPASGDIYRMIKEEYAGNLPEGYRIEEEEEEEEQCL